MFTSSGPTFRELTVQALSSIERGYDLLAPKFDATPFRTPDRLL
ncbi:SAM-dependent methyltransferase, partial [Streptomyces sp. CWNU-1]|nr:SAM-dependent methyltransferase [Streptomyces sp. CWNU-1]